jgi:hypothetical protein
MSDEPVMTGTWSKRQEGLVRCILGITLLLLSGCYYYPYGQHPYGYYPHGDYGHGYGAYQYPSRPAEQPYYGNQPHYGDGAAYGHEAYPYPPDAAQQPYHSQEPYYGDGYGDGADHAYAQPAAPDPNNCGTPYAPMPCYHGYR